LLNILPYHFHQRRVWEGLSRFMILVESPTICFVASWGYCKKAHTKIWWFLPGSREAELRTPSQLFLFSYCCKSDDKVIYSIWVSYLICSKNVQIKLTKQIHNLKLKFFGLTWKIFPITKYFISVYKLTLWN